MFIFCTGLSHYFVQILLATKIRNPFRISLSSEWNWKDTEEIVSEVKGRDKGPKVKGEGHSRSLDGPSLGAVLLEPCQPHHTALSATCTASVSILEKEMLRAPAPITCGQDGRASLQNPVWWGSMAECVRVFCLDVFMHV